MKILAIDDDPIILELLGQFLSAIGDHDLTTAETGMEALEVLAQTGDAGFDCFLVDIQMPVMDGMEVVRRVRAMKQYEETPIAMLTAMSEKKYIDAAFAAGATDYVTKPFEVTELKMRLGLLEDLAKAKRPSARKIFAVEEPQAEVAPAPVEPPAQFEVFEPISIYDVDNVIDIVALENYVTQLSRNSLFGSSCFAFSIRNTQEFYDTLSCFEFGSLVADVAEIISDSLQDHQFLMSYAGSGVFVCVTESGWQPEMDKLKDQVNLALAVTELYNNKGEILRPRVAVSEVIRMVWRSGGSLLETLASAHASAQRAGIAYERELKNLWATSHSA